MNESVISGFGFARKRDDRIWFPNRAFGGNSGSGLVDTSATTMLTVLGALLGAIVWNFFTWWLGLPSSSSHASIGGLCGAAIAITQGNWHVLICSAGTSKVPGSVKMIFGQDPDAISQVALESGLRRANVPLPRAVAAPEAVWPMNSSFAPMLAPPRWLVALAVCIAHVDSVRAQTDPTTLMRSSTSGTSGMTTPTLYDMPVRRASPWDLPIFYPPTPPLLGAPTPLPSLMSSPRGAAPPELANYINEIFYAPLATRLYKKDLSPRQWQKLRAYRAEKTALQKELQEKLETLKTVDPDTRAQGLAQLARAQAARLSQLEKTAEQLRQELIKGEFLQGDVHWNAIRDWRLGDSRFRTPNDAFSAQYQVMLAAAFYQSGLLPEQRGQLREIAMELRGVSRRVSEDQTDRANPPLFFSPETSRLLLPAGLPAALADKIAAYESQKSALKHELREAVYAQDKAYFARTRLRQIEAVAERQWPRIAALEALAEEIRHDLTLLPNPPGPPAPPPLPAGITARITAFLVGRSELRAYIFQKVEELKKTFPIIRIQSAPGTGGSRSSDLRLMVNTKGQTEEQLKVLRATLASFNQEISARQDALRKEEAGIRREFEAMAITAEGQKNPDSLLDEYADVLQQREEWSAYGDCQAAMLTPGLSAEQRRVLFDAGLGSLQLPLPNWEPLTVRVVN